MPEYPVFIGIGSNIGDAACNCARGIEGIGEIDGNKIIAISSFYRSEPIGHIEQDWFVNCVIKIKTDLTPHSLLTALHDVEKSFGRKRDIKYGPRVIDLDVLLFDSLIIDEGEFKIPHPRMHERRFVLEPMSEIDANFTHPVTKKTIKELLRELGGSQKVEPLLSIQSPIHQSEYGFK